MKQVVRTHQAPAAIGTYSQGIKTANLVFLSGCIGLQLDGATVAEGIEAQIRLTIENLRAIAEAAGGNLQQITKITVYVVDLGDYALINELMREYFPEPFPARAVVQVSRLPKDALVEMDAILVLGE